MKRLITATLWLVGCYLLFCLVALGAMLWGELSARHVGDGTRADVALVLGAMQNPDGSLHSSTQRRVDRAVEFYQAGQIGVLMMCGGAPGEGRRATGALMAASAQAQGVPAEALRIEGDSHSTLQNTLFARPLVPQGATVWVL
ncbi:MAG: YdcF family protein, partial [Pseudomonadota bacterium]